ncbi:jasmonate-induced protein homolog [Spinacia oleracea]|uniref:Jasmonate-induced protein homolog n=1 Tax=Spinacia oleracea TaxID=3562 RepID=A0ABM3R1B8_SPIOL|nr:jasmonate-induced protein homolog [Spinacia oleracea]XP_056689426.1 jasmonate-induced protein homolog [Spinacia oleracea]
MGDSFVITGEEQASLDELIKETENLSEFEDAVVAENEGLDNSNLPHCKYIVVNGVLENKTPKPLNVYEEKIWAGGMLKQFPDPLERIGYFIANGIQPQGVMEAVVYKGMNSDGVECGWLLAFMDSDQNGGMKVYVDCGPIRKFMNIDWNAVETKLMHSGTTAKHYDTETQTSVVANIIRYSCDGKTCKDKVTAIFYG